MELNFIELGSEATLAELESYHHEMDLAVMTIRGEMAKVHKLMEPKWAAEQAAKAGPAHLAQSVGIALSAKQ